MEPTTATTDGLFMTFNFEDGETNKVAAPAEVPVAEAKEAEDVKPAEETKQAEKATEAPAAPKTTKRHSYFNVNVFNRERKDKEVAEDKREEETKPEPTEGEAAPAEVKPVDVVAPEASTTAEKSPASSPPKSRFHGIFDRKSEKAEKVILSITLVLNMNASDQISRSLRPSLLRLVPSPPLCQSSPLTQLLLPLRNQLRLLALRLALRSRSASQASSLLSRRRRRPMMSSLTPRRASLLLPSPVHLRFPSQGC